MKPKAKYKPRVEVSDIESTIKILLKGELNTLHKKKVNKWFNDAYSYLLITESYERMAKLKKAQNRYLKQIKK